MKIFRVIALVWLSTNLIYAASNKDLLVKVGERALFDEGRLQITFVDVTNDSRCPEGADCIWAGNAQVMLEVEKKGNKAVVAKLNTGAPPREMVYGSYVIRLKTLKPHPKINAQVQKGDYVVTLVIGLHEELNTPVAVVPEPPKVEVTPVVEQNYLVDVGVHWVGLVMQRGAQLRLEDGSVWDIAMKDQSRVMYWRVSEKVSVSRNPSQQYPFKLTNAGQNTAADARLVVAPK